MAKKGLNEMAFGYAAAGISATGMLLLGVLGNLGIYMKAVEHMLQWDAFFSLSPLGILAGMAETAVWSFTFAYAFAWLYNRYA